MDASRFTLTPQACSAEDQEREKELTLSFCAQRRLENLHPGCSRVNNGPRRKVRLAGKSFHEKAG